MFSKLTESRPCSQQCGSRPSSTNTTRPQSRPYSKGSQVVSLPQIPGRNSGLKTPSTPQQQQQQSNAPLNESSRSLDVLFHSNSSPILGARPGARFSDLLLSAPPKPAARAGCFIEADAVAILVKCVKEIKGDNLQPNNDLINHRLSAQGYSREEVRELLGIGMKNARAAERLHMNTVLEQHQRNVYRDGVAKRTPWTKPVAHPRELRDLLRRNLQLLPMVGVTSGKQGCKVLMHLDYPSALEAVQTLQKNLAGQRAKAVREGRFVYVYTERLTTQQEVDDLTKALRSAV